MKAHASGIIDISQTTCVGHSAGAQGCGTVGETYAALATDGSKLATIYGLDEAGPLYFPTTSVRSGQAELVVCIHTAKCDFGTLLRQCDLDFLPNAGGCVQPTCPISYTQGIGRNDEFKYN